MKSTNTKRFISMPLKVALSLVIAAALLPFGTVFAALPEGFETQVVVSGLALPTSIAFTDDGHIFIAEKGGAVRVADVATSIISPTPVISLADVNDYGDRGLLAITLDPDFANNNFLYLLYSYENTPGQNFEGPKTARAVRVTLDEDYVLIPGSLVVILGTEGGDLAHPSCLDLPVGADCIDSTGGSHTIADMRFGPDGKLYVSVGDASNFDFVDPLAHRALDLDSLNGKVLRINADGSAPSDNPFFTGDSTANRSKVWNYGLRNPFRFSFRPSNDSLYIGDVGWFTSEEINLGTAGANFGWPCHEGFEQTPGYDCVSPLTTDPLYAYGHDPETGAGSVTGGIFYTGELYPSEYQDSYFFGDFALNFIKRLVVDADDNLISVEDFMTSAGGPVEFEVDADGNINYISIYTGEVRRIVYTESNRLPIAAFSASPDSGLSPLTVVFSSDASNDPDGDTLSFTWEFGDGATSSEANPTHTYTEEGDYTTLLTVQDGNGGSSVKTKRIVVGNLAPIASINNPPNGSFYLPGQIIPLFGSAIDSEDGVLPESAYRWQLILHHNIHVHILQELTGSNPSFVAPDHGADPDVYLEVKLTVTDGIGLTDTDSLDLFLSTPSPVRPYHFGTAVEPATPNTLTPVTITTTIGNSGTPDPILVDIELFDAFGNQVAQSFYDSIIIPTNELRDFTLDFTPTVEGTYRVAVGLIFEGWQGLHEWVNNARTFAVGNSWAPTPPNGALQFDGVNDYVDTEVWNIEEGLGFTIEADFVAHSLAGDVHLIAKSSGVALTDYDWMFGIRELNDTEGELLFILKTDNGLTVLSGGVVAVDEHVRAAIIYDNSVMRIVKNGIEVASVVKDGAISTLPNPVWIGNVAPLPEIGAFSGLIDQIRVWNRPLSLGEINQNLELAEIPGAADGLIKNWKFNEGSGQQAIDSSNSGHHGTLGSTPLSDDNDPLFIGGVFGEGGVFDPVFQSIDIIPNPVTAGSETQLTVTATNTGDGPGFAIIDVEIFDGLGNQVFQSYFDGEGFAPGETRDFTVLWTPGSEGEYRVAVGIIYLFWANAYEWVNEAGVVSVQNFEGNTQPVLTLVGDNPLVLTIGDTYVDPGASALDTEDGDITGTVVIGGDTVDTSVSGTYVVSYNVTDSGGLNANQVTRTVIVTDGMFNPVHTETTLSKNPSLTGETVTITTSITNTGAFGAMLVDIEIYDQGVKVAQQIYDNASFAPGETKEFTFDFTPTHEGEYGIDLGFFETGWSGFISWYSHVAGTVVLDTLPTGEEIVIYDDTLRTGWGNWSWDTAVDTQSTAVTSFEGLVSIEATYGAPWGGLYLHHAGIDTTGMTHLTFSIHGGGVGGQGIQIIALDAGNAIASQVPIASYLSQGTVPADFFEVISIPLADLGVLDTSTTGFIFQGVTGNIEPTFYIDAIALH